MMGQVHIIIKVICELQMILIHTNMRESNLLIQTKLIIKLLISLPLSFSLPDNNRLRRLLKYSKEAKCCS